MVFDDGTEQLITGTSDETLIKNVQATQQISEPAATTPDATAPDATASKSVQDDINAIQASIESGGDIEFLIQLSAASLVMKEQILLV